jgi:hypothetical protein
VQAQADAQPSSFSARPAFHILIMWAILPPSNCITYETVEIRPAYLLKYLHAHQMSLIVGHFRQRLLFDGRTS